MENPLAKFTTFEDLAKQTEAGESYLIRKYDIGKYGTAPYGNVFLCSI